MDLRSRAAEEGDSDILGAGKRHISDGSTTIRRSYREPRGLYIGAEFIRTAELQPAQKYATVIEGLDDLEVEGTLDKGGFNGGSSSSLRPPRCEPTGAMARPREVQV